jgi:hypothetical protein
MTTIAARKAGYAILQFSGPVIIDHSDIPPIPARSVSGKKIVVMIVSRLTVAFVSLAALLIWLFSPRDR